MSVQEEFKKIIEVADALMGEGGCIWDHKQTLESLKAYMLEEMYEVLDAVDTADDHNLVEELGDLFYLIVFMAKVGEKEKRFELAEVIACVRKKLIYRHPHVFGESGAKTTEQIKEQWELLKAQEKSERTSQLDGIPKALPSLTFAQKVAGKVEKSPLKKKAHAYTFENEEELGKMLFEVAYAAKKGKFNAELALRQEVMKQEASFREYESTSNLSTKEPNSTT